LRSQNLSRENYRTIRATSKKKDARLSDGDVESGALERVVKCASTAPQLKWSAIPADANETTQTCPLESQDDAQLFERDVRDL
jgi:hypothetical protein